MSLTTKSFASFVFVSFVLGFLLSSIERSGFSSSSGFTFFLTCVAVGTGGGLISLFFEVCVEVIELCLGTGCLVGVGNGLLAVATGDI